MVFDHDLDPLGTGFQQARSLLAIGSGQVTGQGYLQGTQTQSASASALPALRHGFHLFRGGGGVGPGGLPYHFGPAGRHPAAVRVAGPPEPGPSVRLGGHGGVAGMFGAQTLLNVGMCLYVAPVVGVTLPFFSYGGSSS